MPPKNDDVTASLLYLVSVSRDNGRPSPSYVVFELLTSSVA
ncbi:hypothetical protein QBL02_13385 [Leucobacter sp. UT-8R-CII-1-4]|nr:hypothetical protein [Leucobacter sp. UT-8R-CII-1-4]MDI6024531.1 hypothetical protein [Leucobacter sp. UT-8R-CII-1-4]